MLILETNKFKIISDQGREFIPTCKVCGDIASDITINFHGERHNFIGEWKTYITDNVIRTLEVQCCLNRIRLHGRWIKKELDIHDFYARMKGE